MHREKNQIGEPIRLLEGVTDGDEENQEVKEENDEIKETGEEGEIDSSTSA